MSVIKTLMFIKNLIRLVIIQWLNILINLANCIIKKKIINESKNNNITKNVIIKANM